MINAMFDEYKTKPRFIENLLDFLPTPEKLDIKDYNGNICVEREIPISPKDISNYRLSTSGNFEEMIIYAWQRMYHDLTMHVSKMFLGRDDYFIIKMIAMIVDDCNIGWNKYAFRLRIVANISIAESKKVVIPEWSYHVIEDKNIPTEWKCGSCTTPNLPDNRWCSQCGAPRALLLQEMMCIHCGTEKDDNMQYCSQCGAKYVA